MTSSLNGPLVCLLHRGINLQLPERLAKHVQSQWYKTAPRHVVDGPECSCQVMAETHQSRQCITYTSAVETSLSISLHQCRIQLWVNRAPLPLDQNLGLVVDGRSSLPQTRGKFSFSWPLFVWIWTKSFQLQGGFIPPDPNPGSPGAWTLLGALHPDSHLGSRGVITMVTPPR